MTNLPVRTEKERERRQKKRREEKRREEKRREETKSFEVNSMRSQVLYRAAQELACDIGWGEGPLCLGTHHLPEACCRPLQRNHEVLYAL